LKNGHREEGMEDNNDGKNYHGSKTKSESINKTATCVVILKGGATTW
jgi:hypothetical protein